MIMSNGELAFLVFLVFINGILLTILWNKGSGQIPDKKNHVLMPKVQEPKKEE